jgi:hypothetical protein
MRRITLLVLLATAAPAAVAAGRTTVSARPSGVAFGHVLTVRGTGWRHDEFCRKTVTISLESVQNRFRIGAARVKDNGRWTFRYRPRAAKVGAGRWRVLARLRCYSGRDGHAIFVTRRSRPVRIHR